LIDSIQKKLFLLPDEVKVFPGHGAPTTLGEEKMYNPFCALSVRA
jgi:glyoxylase-like metal-dependent hydrolase (beta-lactamase superfamily II)